jgi:hypothetical protein
MEAFIPPAILQTQAWINNVVIGLQFCPFAAKPFKQKTIDYTLCTEKVTIKALEAVARYMDKLHRQPNIETGLLIFEHGFKNFHSYLQLLDVAERLLKEEGYEGIFQIASFHPKYLFAGSNDNDPSNYTNRSPFPMLHFLREASLEQMVLQHPNTEKIPQDNIAFCHKKGLAFMQNMLQQSITTA